MTNDAIEWLQELFPDHRYYSAAGGKFPTQSDRLASCAKSLFAEGPARLWLALWGGVSSLGDLRRRYAADDVRWGVSERYGDILEDLQTKVFCSFDFDEEIDEDDLVRAIVLLRGSEGFSAALPEIRVDAYLCTKAILADIGIKYASLGVLHEITDYLAFNELKTVLSDWRYRKAIKQHWAGQRMLGERGVLEYVNNPFFQMIEHAPTVRLARRWESFAQLTHYNYHRSRTSTSKLSVM